MQTVQGYCIEFDSVPFQNILPRQIQFNEEQKAIVNKEVEDLLQKGAIQLSQSEPGQYISNIFIVPKPGGKFRPIINLKHLNEFITYKHFKQEHFKIVLDLIQKNDFFCKLDLTDAYFAIPIHKAFRKYLKFFWDSNLYEFRCLCFGLSSAPRIFTKVLKPIYAWFRYHGLRCSYYIDDSLNMNKNCDTCKNSTELMSDTLQSLGFVVNKKKSILIPTQRIVFFGFILDSVLFMVFLTDEKVAKIISCSSELLDKESVSIRAVASFIGLVINAFYAVLEAPMHYRSLERDKVSGLGIDKNFDRKIILSQDSLDELLWCLNSVRKKNGKHIRPPLVQFRCCCDASFLGWGCFDEDQNKYANGRWDSSVSDKSINFLELLAIFHAMRALYSEVSQSHIEIRCDNISAVAYVNDMGGMVSLSMDRLAKELWEWCLNRDIFISAIYIPGKDNVRADYYSRNFSDSTEWSLKQEIFNRICKQFFQPNIDLFASDLNRKLEKYVSWFSGESSFGYDAFSMPWNELTPYLFPPFSLIGKVMNKVVTDQVDKAILVFPFWKSATWFPLVLNNIISLPIRLPHHRDLLILEHSGVTHPLQRRLTMVAVIISGKPCRVKGFQDLLPTSLSRHGDEELVNSMNLRGESGVFGVVKNVQILFQRLKVS